MLDSSAEVVVIVAGVVVVGVAAWFEFKASRQRRRDANRRQYVAASSGFVPPRGAVWTPPQVRSPKTAPPPARSLGARRAAPAADYDSPVMPGMPPTFFMPDTTPACDPHPGHSSSYDPPCSSGGSDYGGGGSDYGGGGGGFDGGDSGGGGGDSFFD